MEAARQGAAPAGDADPYRKPRETAERLTPSDCARPAWRTDDDCAGIWADLARGDCGGRHVLLRPATTSDRAARQAVRSHRRRRSRWLAEADDSRADPRRLPTWARTESGPGARHRERVVHGRRLGAAAGGDRPRARRAPLRRRPRGRRPRASQFNAVARHRRVCGSSSITIWISSTIGDGAQRRPVRHHRRRIWSTYRSGTDRSDGRRRRRRRPTTSSECDYAHVYAVGRGDRSADRLPPETHAKTCLDLRIVTDPHSDVDRARRAHAAPGACVPAVERVRRELRAPDLISGP